VAKDATALARGLGPRRPAPGHEGTTGSPRPACARTAGPPRSTDRLPRAPPQGPLRPRCLAARAGPPQRSTTPPAPRLRCRPPRGNRRGRLPVPWRRTAPGHGAPPSLPCSSPGSLPHGTRRARGGFSCAMSGTLA
jgi:hypothetical protein